MQLRKVDFMVAVVGSIAAATLAAIAFAILTPLNETRSAFGSFFVYFPFCLIGEFFIGLPLFLAMLKMNVVRWWIWLSLSLLLGIALGLFVGGVPGRDSETFIATLSVSLISAVVFRLALAMSTENGA